MVDALEALGVRYCIGGSVASSAHGVPRASIDADVVADLDIVGVLKMVWPQAEHEYLGRWAAALGVGDLLDRARAGADPDGR